MKTLRARSSALLLAGLTAAGCSSSNPGGTNLAPRRIAGPRGELAVDDGGRGGIPVLFVHGNGGNRSQWRMQLDHLRRSRRAAAFDLRGMGESAPAGNGDYSVKGFAEDVAAVADGLGLSRFVLVGHSFGGAVVAAYAGSNSHRLAGLVFADSAGDLEATPPEQIEILRKGLQPETYARFTRAWFDGILAHARDETRAEVNRSLAATPREVFTGATLGLYEFDFSGSLARYSGPRLSISSFLFANPLAVHRAAPGMPVREISGASHWLMMDRPEEFNRILDEFLAALK